MQSDRPVIAVDIAKSVFEIAVSKTPGQVVQRERLPRAKFLEFFADRSVSVVVMEACGSAHHWARLIKERGHEVVLLPPQLVRPYVKRNKTDRTDAKGILEAYRNEEIRPVPVKSLAQHVITALHRLRSGWVAERTARLNALRGVLREIGIVIVVGAYNVVPALRSMIADADSGIPDALRSTLSDACNEIVEIEARIDRAEKQLKAIAKQTPLVVLLLTIPGVGLLTATALVGFIGDVQRFPSARHFAGYLGLTPREFSTGYMRRLGGITKRGDAYLRMLLIHGARAVLLGAKRVSEPDRLRTWALTLEKTHKHNVAAVALANKMARVVWAVWKHGRPFERIPALKAVA